VISRVISFRIRSETHLEIHVGIGILSLSDLGDFGVIEEYGSPEYLPLMMASS
jgi:hypothetical protein